MGKVPTLLALSLVDGGWVHSVKSALTGEWYLSQIQAVVFIRNCWDHEMGCSHLLLKLFISQSVHMV